MASTGFLNYDRSNKFNAADTARINAANTALIGDAKTDGTVEL